MEGIRFTEEEINEVESSLDFGKLQGILPAIAVGEEGQVLMLAFMNREALRATLRTGRMHYWSRSRKRLWMKGEESGHYQYVLGLYADCDSDALLFRVRQVGPACHTGEGSCFLRPVRAYSGREVVLSELEGVIRARMGEPREGSYTSKVISAGPKEAAKKLGEEAVEVSIASLAEDKERTVSESADLVYHLLLLLQMKGIAFGEVLDELRRRRREKGRGNGG